MNIIELIEIVEEVEDIIYFHNIVHSSLGVPKSVGTISLKEKVLEEIERRKLNEHN